jgi:hypothetical protein
MSRLVIVGYLLRLLHALSDDELGQSRGRGDGAAAAEGLELGVGYYSLLVDAKLKLKGVSTSDGADLGFGVGVIYLAHVFRVEEVFLDLF